MKNEKTLQWFSAALICLGMLLLPPLALSQSCSLCYTQAASSGSRMIEALRSGILILIVPPTLMWLVLGAIVYAKRNKYKRVRNAAECSSDW